MRRGTSERVAAVARVAVAVLAKAPLPGYAKTRLIPRLGEAGAARLQAWLLARTLATVRAAVGTELAPPTLWCAPDCRHPAFAAAGCALRRQPTGDLGERMAAALAPADGTLVIGTDCPLLSPAILCAAAHALHTHDAVLLPVEDGGYALIGLARADARPFAAIDWSTPQVLAQTRARFAAAGWRWHELPTLWDVDDEAGFARLTAAFPELLHGPL